MPTNENPSIEAKLNFCMSYARTFSIGEGVNNGIMHSIDNEYQTYLKILIGEILDIDFVEFYKTERRRIRNEDELRAIGFLAELGMKHTWFIGDVLTGVVHEAAFVDGGLWKTDEIEITIKALYNTFQKQYARVDLEGTPMAEVLQKILDRLEVLEKAVL